MTRRIVTSATMVGRHTFPLRTKQTEWTACDICGNRNIRVRPERGLGGDHFCKDCREVYPDLVRQYMAKSRERRKRRRAA